MILFPLMPFAQELSEHVYSSPTPAHEVVPKEQKYVFYPEESLSDIQKDLEEINSIDVQHHAFGDAVAKRLHLFENAYTYYSEPAPGAFSGKKVIDKPVIYHTIYKIDKHLRKQVRKEVITKTSGADKLNYYLELALMLQHENIDVLKEDLKKTRKAQEMMEILSNVSMK